MVKRGNVIGNAIAASLMAFMVAALVVACGGGVGGNGNGLMGFLTAYTVGGTVSGLTGTGLVLQNNGGDNLSITANGAFTFASAVATSSPYSVTVLTQPTSTPALAQRCNVANGSGIMGNANVTNVAVNCFSPRYALTANSSNNTVSSYRVDAVTGLLTLVGTVGAGTNPRSVTVDPSGTHAYVANFGSNTVSQFAIAADGSLTQIAAVVAAGTYPTSVTVDPTGKYAYVANQNTNDVSQYTIGANGALTPMSPASVASAGTNPQSVTVDPTGRYVYVANRGYGSQPSTNSVSQYTIGANGALTSMSPASVTAGHFPNSVTVDPSGGYAYVANSGSNNVSQYTIGTGGALTAMASAVVAAGTTPQSVTVDPSGKYAYVANSGSNNVSQYTIGTGGALTAMGTPTVATGTTPQSVTVDPSGYYAYVTNGGSNTVSQYTIGTTGGLTALTPATATATAPVSLAMSAGAPVVSVSTSKYLYVALNGPSLVSSNVVQFTIGASGVLTAMSPASSPTTSAAPMNMAVDPTIKYAYVANHNPIPFNSNASSYSISQYTIGGTGNLTPMSAPASVVNDNAYPNSVTVDPTGKYAYVLYTFYNYANSTLGTINRYTIGSSGALSWAASVVTGVMPLSMVIGTIGPSNTHAYVVNMSDNTISQYTIDPNNGNPTAMGTAVPTGASPRYITLDPSGTHAYVANTGDGTISQYTILSNGVLSPMNPASVPAVVGSTTSSPISVTIDSSGNYAYVSNLGSSNVSQFTIASGALSPMQTATVTVPASGVSAAPRGIAIDASGKYAYVADCNGGGISLFNISPTGGLTYVSMFSAGTAQVPCPLNPITAGVTVTWH